MKKIALTIAIILGFGMIAFADPNGGGLFQRGLTPDEEYYGLGYNNINRECGAPMLPAHGNPDNADAPVGSGIAALVGLGAAYLVAKRRKEE